MATEGPGGQGLCPRDLALPGLGMYNHSLDDLGMKGLMGLPPVLFFPYVDLDPALLKGLLCLFQGVELLQPAFSVSGSFTEECEEAGWVKVHRPLPVEVGTAGARRLIREFERLVAMHQDSGYLSYLKHGGEQWLEEERSHDVLREIRNYGQGISPPDGLETLRGQLLLQLAQDLDRQRREIQEALAEVGHLEKALQLGMGVGREDEGDTGWEMEPLPSVEEDEFLIPQRLRAWAEILCALKEDPLPLLITESRVAMEHLLETWMAGSEEGVTGPMVLMQVTLPRFFPADVEGLKGIREILGGLLPWRIFCDHLADLLRGARKGTRSGRPLGETVARARALASYFQDSVRDSILEAVVGLEPSWEEGWRDWVLEVALFPGQEEETLLRGGGNPPDAGADTNALILYLRDGEGPEKGA